MIIFKTLFKTLNKNASSFTITDEAISNNSIFEVYPSDDSVILADVTVNGTTANITFDSAAEYNIPCAIFINNLVGEYGGLPDIPYETRFLKSGNNNAYWGQITARDVYYDNNHLDDTMDTVTRLLDNIATELFNDTVTGGVFYHASSGNEWKRLTGSDVDYDVNTTINEKLDEVFQSVSNGKSVIASAITDKGVPTLATDTFQTMADHIAEIEGAGGIVQHEEYYGNAVALYNKTVTSQLTGTFRAIIYTYTDGTEVIKKNGTTINAVFSDTRSSVHHYAFYEFEVSKNDSINFSVNNSGDNSFCLGWYITDGTSGGGGTDVSDTTAVESDVLLGKIFHKADGSRAVGTLENIFSQFATGNVKLTTTAGATLDIGFKPKILIVIQAPSTTSAPTNYIVYDENVATDKQILNGSSQISLPTSSNNRIGSITDSGFVLNKITNATTIPYAIYYAFA